MSATTRRGLLTGAGALAAGVVAGPGRGLVDLLAWWQEEPGELVRSSMAARLNERFGTTASDGHRVELTLASIEELPVSTISNSEGQFAARFEAPLGTDLRQDTHRLDNRLFGTVDIFLSPIHDPGDRLDRYEALFNRPAEVES